MKGVERSRLAFPLLREEKRYEQKTWRRSSTKIGLLSLAKSKVFTTGRLTPLTTERRSRDSPTLLVGSVDRHPTAMRRWIPSNETYLDRLELKVPRHDRHRVAGHGPRVLVYLSLAPEWICGTARRSCPLSKFCEFPREPTEAR